MDALFSCCGDTLCLPLADQFALILGDKREKLEHDITQKGAQEILRITSVQQRHIQYYDIYALFSGQYAPLFLNLCIVTAQPVNAFDIEYVARPHPA